MGFMNEVMASVKGMFGNQKKDEFESAYVDKVLDVMDDGRPLFQEDIIDMVMESLDKRKQEKLPTEQMWRLCANFLMGNQYCDINTKNGDVAQIPVVRETMERETFNRIAPIIETRIANIKKIKYDMSVKPSTNELDDYAKAGVSTAILQHTQNVTDFQQKNNTAIHWNELCGSCFWISWWDKNKGKKYANVSTTKVSEDGQEVTEETVMHEGDLDYGLLTPYEIFPESCFKQGIESQRSIIVQQVKTAEDIFDLYGVKVEGTSVDTFCLTPMAVNGGLGHAGTVNVLSHRSVEESETVTTYFERRSVKYPDGRLIIIVGTDKLIYYGNLPYEQIPIQMMVCKEVAGQFFGRSVIEDLIPLQRAYNGCVNRIHEYIKRISLGVTFVEGGSIENIDELIENGLEAGAIYEVLAGSQLPQPSINGNLPREMLEERAELQSNMEYVGAVSQLMVIGATPQGVTSGTAIESLREIDNTRLSLTGEHIRTATKNLAKQWLEIYKLYANSKRIMQYTGSNAIGDVVEWTSEDITSFDIEFDTENELLRSAEAQKERFLDMYKMGLFNEKDGQPSERMKQKALEYMQQDNYTEIMNINQLHTQSAQRENQFFEKGSFPQISEFDDHDVHVEEHLRYILQMKFQLLKMKKPQYAQALEEHLRMHKQELANAEQAMVQSLMPQPQLQ